MFKGLHNEFLSKKKSIRSKYASAIDEKHGRKMLAETIEQQREELKKRHEKEWQEMEVRVI
jgi:hypothetical protein